MFQVFADSERNDYKMKKQIISFLLLFILTLQQMAFADGRVNPTLSNLEEMSDNMSSTNEAIFEDFEKPIVNPRFQMSDNVSVEADSDGNHVLRMKGTSCSLSLGEEIWDDFVCQFDVKMLDYGWMGFDFRTGNDGYYTAMLGNLAHTQQFTMRKYNPSQTSLSTLGKPMELNKTYTIKLVVQKNLFELYFEDNVLITGVDNELSRGTLRFTTKTGNVSPTLLLDNISIEPIVHVPVEGIRTDTPELTVEVGEKLRLPMDIEPYNAYDTDVTIISDDPTVARTEDYSVIGEREGAAKLTCTTVDGGHKLEYNVTVKKKTFDDIKGHAAKEAIEELAGRGKISGDENGKFYPDAELTRAEAAAFAVKLVGYDLVSYGETGDMPYLTEDGVGFASRGIFDDVSAEDWYANFCQTAYEAEILNNGLYKTGSFMPENSINRQDAVTLLVETYEKIIGGQAPAAAEVEFSDMDQVSEYAAPYVGKAAELGILGGETVNPEASVTRAEFAVMEAKLLESIDSVGAMPVVPLKIEVEKPREKSGIVVDAADFGMTPYNPEDPYSEKFDNFPALKAAMDYCVEVDASKLTVPKGWYYFNTKDILRFDNVKDFTFDGQGSTFVLGVVTSFFRCEGCERFEFKNVTFDWDWDKKRLADIIEITARDSEKKTLDIKYLSCDYVAEEDVSLTTSVGARHVTDISGNADGTPTTKYVIGDADGLPKTKIVLSDVKRRSDNEFTVTYSNATLDERLRAGSLIRAIYYNYAGTTMIAYGMKNFTIDNVTIYSNVGIGFCFYNDMENWQIINSTIDIRPGCELTHPVSSLQDGIQVNNMSNLGHFKIENCFIGYQNDDGTNVHQNISVGIQLDDEDRYSFIAKGSDWSKPLREGEKAGFMNPDFTDTGFQSTVIESEYIDKVGRKVKLADKVPQNLQSNTIVINKSFGSAWGIIRGNTFEGNHGRGLLVRGNHILVENNKFKNISSSAIMTEIEITSQWISGTPSSDLIFRGNEMDSCNENEARSVMQFTSNLLKGYNPAIYLSQNILFENNKFKNTIGKSFAFDRANNVTIRNNTFTEFSERQNVKEDRAKIGITNSNNIKIYGNVFESSEFISDDADEMYTADETSTNIQSYDNVLQKQ